MITPPPTFFGVDQVVDPKTGTTLVLKWNSAITPNPAGDVFTACTDCVYDIFRVEHVEPGDGTQEPTFTPSDANRIAQGVSGNEFTDTARQLGQIYYYIVQARNTAGKKDTDDTGQSPGSLQRADDQLIQVVCAVPAGNLRIIFS